MPPDETLEAVVKIRDQASEKLDDIASELDSVHDAALAAGRGARSAADAFEKAEDEASGLEKALDSLEETLDETAGTLEVADSAAEAAGDSFEEAARDANQLDRALSGVNRSAAAATGSLGTVGAAEALSSGGDVDLENVSRTVEKTTEMQSEGGEKIKEQHDEIDGTTVETTVETESEGLDSAEETLERVDGTTVETDVQQTVTREDRGDRGGLFSLDDEGGIADMMDDISRTFSRGLNLDIPDFEETRREAESLQGIFAGLPALDVDIEDEEEFDNLANNLQRVASAGDRASRSLKAIDDDELIEAAGSTRELRRALSRTDHGTVRTEQSLRNLEGASRDLFDNMVLSASGVDAFEERSEQLGDRALRTSGRLNDLEGQMRDIAVQALISANNTDEFSDEVAEAGREATSTAAQIEMLDAAMSDLGPSIGDVSTRVAGFQTSLATLGRITPMVLSLTSAIGGLATAAVTAGGVMGGIFAGGLLAVGEQMGNQMAAANAGMDDLEGNAKDAVEAQSQLERTMAGVSEFMDRVKESAYEAMEPLMNRQTAEFAVQGIEGALTLLHEFAQLANDLSPLVMDFGMDVAATWWEEWPDIARELGQLMEMLLPIFGDLVKGAIRALPGLFDSMAQEGSDLLPLLGDFFAVLIDMLPTITRLGTAMLTLLIPVLEGFALALEWLEPLTTLVAEGLILLGQTFGDVITTVAAVVGVLYAASSALSTVGLVAGGVTAILTGALDILTGFVTYILAGGVAQTVATWAARFGSVATILKGILTTIYGIIVGLGTVGTILTGAGILLALGAIMSYFDLWDDLLQGVIMSWNRIVAIMQAAALLLNDITGMFDKLPEKVGTLEVATSKAEEWASKIPGQDNEDGGGGGGGDDGWLPDVDIGGGDGWRPDVDTGDDGSSMRPTPSRRDQGSASRPGRQRRDGQYDSGTTIEEVNIDSSPETNDAEIKRAAREAIQEANKEERRRNSSLN